jgi:hypothetical protein
MTAPTDLVRRLVDEVMDGGDLDVLDELCTASLSSKLRRAFSQFRSAFPDWHQEVREFVTDGRTVVARMRCTGSHRGEWQVFAQPADACESTRSTSSASATDGSPDFGALKTRGPGCVNSPATRHGSANSGHSARPDEPHPHPPNRRTGRLHAHNGAILKGIELVEPMHTNLISVERSAPEPRTTLSGLSSLEGRRKRRTRIARDRQQ